MFARSREMRSQIDMNCALGMRSNRGAVLVAAMPA
jgi:hypothetical protein